MESVTQNAEPQKIMWFELNKKWIANGLKTLAEEVDEGDVQTASEFFNLLQNLQDKFTRDYESDANFEDNGAKYAKYVKKRNDKASKRKRSRFFKNKV